MIIQAIAFWIFAIIAVVSGILVVANRNPVYSVLFLILTFFNAAGLFVLMGAEFLAMMLVVVYVGAVAVLFLFVVMMLDINFVALRQGFVRYLPIGAIIGVMTVYLVLQIGVLGAVDWHRMLDPNSAVYQSMASVILEQAWGRGPAEVVTTLILITPFASVLAGLLAGSRVPYDAARDGVFFRSFARLHPRHRFPTAGLITMGVITAAGFMIGRHTDMGTLIQLLTTVIVLVLISRARGSAGGAP